MKVHYKSLLLIGLSLVLLVGSPLQAEVLPVTPAPAGEPLVPIERAAGDGFLDLKEAASRSVTSAGLISERIDVAVGDTYDRTPAVALCASDQYLVVYEREGAIYGQRLTSDGDLLGSAFLISSGANPNWYPDVACDWYYNRFVVVWQYDYDGDGSDWDVLARGVWGDHQLSGSQLYGSELAVSQDGSGVDEQTPAIACNSDDHSCLVAFGYSGTGNGDIWARRVSVGASDISNQGDRFSVGGFARQESTPDVTWGGYDHDYLVVWQYLQPTPTEHSRILTAYVWDTHQVGSQLQTAATYLIAPGTYDHDQFGPVVAYNRYTRQYLVVFTFDFSGDHTDRDTMALRLTPGGGSVGGVFPVASSATLDEMSNSVAFSGGTQSISGGLGANQFLVTYDTRDRIYVQAIKGAHAVDGGQHEGDPVQLGSDIDYETPSVYVSDATGSVNNGRYLVAWEVSRSGTGDDILGQLVGPYTVLLPIVLNNHDANRSMVGDPAGDWLPGAVHLPSTDILAASAERRLAEGEIILTMDLAGDLPPTLPAQERNRWVWLLDTDMNAGTGLSWYDIGAEYEVNLHIQWDGFYVDVHDWNDNWTTVPGAATIDGSTATLRIPVSYLGGSTRFNWMAVVEPFDRAGDRFDVAPNSGHGQLP